MTDQPPTNPGDVWATGQRRQPNGLFPRPGGGGGGGGGGDDGETHQQEVGDEDPTPGTYVDPCSSPATGLPWNADAAGAAAPAKFLLKAAEIGFGDAPNGVPNLLNREFGAFLIRGSDQAIGVGPVTPGNARNQADPNWVSTLTIDPAGVTAANYQGDVHSHPNGNPLPSQEDWDGFINNNNQARQAGRTDESFFMYVIAVDQSGGPSKIYVYEDGPRAVGSSNPPRPTSASPEVNPDAQPCP